MINKHLRLLMCMAVVIVACCWMVLATRPVKGQDTCWPEMQRVHSSMEDVQRIRVTGEAQEELLRQILVELKKRK